MDMRYIDCFAGTGSMTLALHEMLGQVAAYCEIDEAAQAVLRHNMRRGLLPKAPIISDVCSVTQSSVPAGVQALTASWPCVGHSSLGLKQGLQNVESKLFHEIIRLCDEFNIQLLFLENVRAMLINGGKAIIEMLVSKGFNIHYAVIPAGAVGSPQHRERWFCVAMKPGFSYRRRVNLGKKFVWTTAENKIPRMVHALGEARQKAFRRCAILGNALVPDQIRLAFVFLMTGRLDIFGSTTVITSHFPTSTCTDLKNVSDMPPHACVLGGKLHRLTPPRFAAPVLQLELVASNYTHNKPLNPAVTSGLLDSKKCRCWATPRKSMTGACNVLTTRSSRDLPTMLRFERGTHKLMATGIMNPVWVEWLMGFPSGWTDY